MTIIIVLLCIILSTTSMVSALSFHNTPIQPVHRGEFTGEIGLRNDSIPIIELDGTFRDFRGRHLVVGSLSPIDSDRSNRFQGLLTRNIFLLQTGYRNSIVNIIGRFISYDTENSEFSGPWRGFVLGYGRTYGWITINLSP